MVAKDPVDSLGESADAKQKVADYLRLSAERNQDPDTHDWSTEIINHLSVVSASTDGPHPRVVFRMTVQKSHSNAMGNLHGGCTSTIFDFCTSLVVLLVNGPKFWHYLGVSRTLNVTYLTALPIGTVIDIDCELVHIGKRLCHTRGVIRAVSDDGKEKPVAATCEHGKVNVDPKL